MPKPLPYDHIILISVDTLRSDCLGANPFCLWSAKYPGLVAPDTQAIDEWARAGTFFPRTISAAPYTSASHASILTGRWPLHHGVYEFFRSALHASTVFTRAKLSGYTTVLKVDFPVILGGALGFDRDVDHYLIEEDDAALAILSTERRTVSCMHFGGVHIPYGFHSLRFGADAYRDKVDALEKELPLDDRLPVDRLTETYRDPEDAELLVRYKRVVSHLYRTGQFSKLFSLYLEGVEYFTAKRLAPFLERLVDAMAGKRWLAVLFGDHGEEYDDVSYGHFNTLAEGVLRVPAVFVGSDVQPRLLSDRIRTIDIGATVLDALGDRAYVRRRTDGASLLGVIRGEAEPMTGTAFSQAYIPETRAHVTFQEKFLRDRPAEIDLPHFRYKEAVYHNDWKLTRQNFRHRDGLSFGEIVPTQPDITLEHVAVSEVTASHNDSVQTELISLLDAYNRSGVGGG